MDGRNYGEINVEFLFEEVAEGGRLFEVVDVRIEVLVMGGG